MEVEESDRKRFNEIQFGFMSEKGTINAVFILEKLQEEYHAKKKVVFV